VAVEVLFVANTRDSYAAGAVLGKTAFESNKALLKVRREWWEPCAE
jgi:hypothetical protein